MRGVRQLLGTVLLALGAALLLGVGALSAYSAYERAAFERELGPPPVVPSADELADAEPAGEPVAAEPAAVAAEPTPPSAPATATAAPAPSPLSTAAAAPRAAPPPEPTATPTTPPPPTPTAPPTATPAPQKARWIIAEKIRLSSPVVESPIKDGEWQVPKFVAGHLEGTAAPGGPGNVVLSGHFDSISSGNVFASIERLAPGDVVTLLTDRAELRYVVREKRVVANTDLSVVAPTPDETLTLITCTGNWLPLARDYDQRLIVIAGRAPSPARPAPTPRGMQ